MACHSCAYCISACGVSASGNGSILKRPGTLKRKSSENGSVPLQLATMKRFFARSTVPLRMRP